MSLCFRQLLEFGLGITLMSSQIFISLFADNDKGVMDVFFGLFTFTKVSLNVTTVQFNLVLCAFCLGRHSFIGHCLQDFHT